MRLKFLIACMLGLVTATAFAQKGEVTNAREAFDKYDLLSKAGGGDNFAAMSIATAQTAIDKASANAKTTGLPETNALKADIYSVLALRDTVAATSAPLFNTATEALKKAKDLDVKGEFTKNIAFATTKLAQYQLNKGIKAFKQKNYDQAYQAFDFYRQAKPEDTTAIYYTGLSAAAGGNYPAALTNYAKLVTTNYTKNYNIYLDMTLIYLKQKDTTTALKTVGEGIQKYPTNPDLRKLEIEISLQSGKQQEVIGKILSAIANDPKNKELYFYAGLTYAQFAEGAGDEALKTKDPTAKSALLAKKNDQFSKAAEMYKKAVDLDPNYFDANLNLGYAYINPAIDMFNAANNLPINKKKEYDDAIAKANAQFALAKPYLLKAVELDPKSIDALANLKTYYQGTKDAVNVTATQKKIDDLKVTAPAPAK